MSGTMESYIFSSTHLMKHGDEYQQNILGPIVYTEIRLMTACTFFIYFEICISCHYVNCSSHRQLQYHIWNTNICVLDGFSFFQILSGWEPKDMSYADAVFITHTDSSTSSHPPLTSSSSSNPQKPVTFSHQPTSSENPRPTTSPPAQRSPPPPTSSPSKTY